MKKIFFILSFLPLWGAGGFGSAFAAPVSVSVVPITANYAATPPTVTFRLSWPAGSRSDDNRSKVWVFVEYKKVLNNAYSGSWTRAEIAGAATVSTLQTATASSVTGNDSGFFVQGPATGDFAATVTVPVTVNLAGHDSRFGWCAYVIDRPPHAEAKQGYYALHGTPPFTITTTSNGATVTESSHAYNNTCIYGLTDATGCPPDPLPFTPPEIIGFTASASSICAGQSVTLTAITTGDAASYSFNNGNSWKTTNTTVRTPPVPGFTYTLLVQPSPGACTVSASTTHPVTVRPLPVPVFDNPPAAICANSAATLTASGAGSGGSYCFTYECTACVRNPYLTGNDEPAASDCYWYSECIYDEANTYTVAIPDAGSLTVWVRAKNEYGCVDSTSIAYSAFSAGSIATASATITLGTASTATIASLAPASGGDGNITYEWRRSGTSSHTLTGSDSPDHTISSDASNYDSMVGTYSFTRYAKDGACNTTFTASEGQFTLTVAGVNQQQGSCTFTQPPLVGTFAAFPATYSASTFVTLMDERDGNNYTVVKIGDRWIMAQNLNYQKDLTWQANSNMPSTGTGQNTALIGHFWCPGGYSSTTVTSTRASCDVWGALYSWETAMSFDGLGSWSENATYNTGAANAANSKFNHGRSASGSGTGGRGICPPNWHVPTDFEWGVLLDAMESDGGTVHQTTSSVGTIGTNASSRGKAACTVGDNSTSGNTYVNDTQTNWYYDASSLGTDNFGFRVLPAGARYFDGAEYYLRGERACFRTSSAYSSVHAWMRTYAYNDAEVHRYGGIRSYGMSVRCIRD